VKGAAPTHVTTCVVNTYLHLDNNTCFGKIILFMTFYGDEYFHDVLQEECFCEFPLLRV